MSKFVRIATQIKDKGCLQDALKDVNATVTHQRSVRGWGGRRDVDLAVVTSKGEVGFAKTNDGSYELVGDDMYIPQGFVDKLTQRYARHKVLKQASQAGFTVTEEKVQRDNSIRLVVRKW